MADGNIKHVFKNKHFCKYLKKTKKLIIAQKHIFDKHTEKRKFGGKFTQIRIKK